VRRRLYEIFLDGHLLAAIALLVFILLHLKTRSVYVIGCLSVAVGMLLLQKILWFICFVYRNVGSGPSCRASIVTFPRSRGGDEVLQVRVKLKRPWKVKPCHFVYLSLPWLRSLGLGLFEAHPFMIAWSDENEGGTTIVLLVKCHRGFTRKLRLAKGSSRALIDGPYGSNRLQSLSRYDKVLFLADGIGIAAHLLPIRHLIHAHNDQTARVRRLSLVWLLETEGNLPFTPEYIIAG
jgi:predicted ferric reductase